MKNSMIAQISENNGISRVVFSAELTLLAWVRTGIATMLIGLVIARFDFFMRPLAMQAAPQVVTGNSLISMFAGLAFIMLGSASIIIAALQHSRFIKTLAPELRLASSWSMPATFIAYAIAWAGFVIAGELLIYSW